MNTPSAAAAAAAAARQRVICFQSSMHSSAPALQQHCGVLVSAVVGWGGVHDQEDDTIIMLVSIPLA